MANEQEKNDQKQTDPMEEKQDLSVTVKVGRAHYDALVRWSKERFGMANQAGFLRLMIQERWQQEQKEKAVAESISS